jgi:hypothetical protein
MASLVIKRPVQIIAIVTEDMKKELTAELSEASDQAQRRIEQMEFQGRRYLADIQRTNLTQAMAVRQQLEKEKGRYEDVKKELTERIAEVTGLEIGAEYPRGTVESEVEIATGDNLFEKLSATSIVVKDGIVQEIRGL